MANAGRKFILESYCKLLSFSLLYVCLFQIVVFCLFQWFFDCNCVRCTDPTECGSYISALLCKSGHLSIYLSIHPFIYLSIYPSVLLSIHLSICLSTFEYDCLRCTESGSYISALLCISGHLQGVPKNTF